MIINDKNQNDIFDEMEIDYVFSNNPINRIHKIDEQENKTQLLVDLEKKIQNIENNHISAHYKKTYLGILNFSFNFGLKGIKPVMEFN